MARAKGHGNGKLDEALTALVQAQAVMVQTQATYLAEKVESDKRIGRLDKDLADFRAECKERFANIEAILVEHNRILRAMPDLLGEKIGFKPPETQPSGE